MRNCDIDANKSSVKKDLTFILVVKAWSLVIWPLKSVLVIGAILSCLSQFGDGNVTFAGDSCSINNNWQTDFNSI